MRFVCCHAAGLCCLALLAGCGEGSAAAAPTPVGPTAPTAPPMDNAGILLRGRFDAPAEQQPNFAWSNSAMAVHFTGSQISLRLRETPGWFQGSVVDDYYDVIVDRQAPSVLSVNPNTTEYPLASGLGPGEHTVWVVKRTEASVGTGQFLGFDLGSDGVLLAPPTVPTRRIEFVGDSEFPGYGVDESVDWTDMCSFSAATENADESVPKLTADALQADMMNLAYSGKGILQNLSTDDNVTLPALYGRTNPADSNSTWDFNQWVPDVVVLDAGGNDLSGPNGQGWLSNWNGFVSAYVGFVQSIRAHYPHATILCSISAAAHGQDRQTLHDAINEAVNQVGDAQVQLFDYFANDPNHYQCYDDAAQGQHLAWGCDYHPSAAGAQFLAQRLATAIKAQRSW